MIPNVWISLTLRELTILENALSIYADGEAARPKDLAPLSKKLMQATTHPEITIGVYGGRVQWALGNSFPIRIRDYDGEERDLPDMDEHGERCRTWFEPADVERAPNSAL